MTQAAVFSKAPLVTAHQGLLEFEGTWKVEQKQWASPTAKPVVNHGHSTCTKLLDGLATLITIETDGPNGHFKGTGLFTWNHGSSKFESAWIDSYSQTGLLLMNGSTTPGPSRAALKAEVGAVVNQARTWQALPSPGGCVGPVASQLVAAKATALSATESLPLRLVENKVNNDKWVLEFFAPGVDGNEFLVQQNTYTR